jgi:hypothetical protein
VIEGPVKSKEDLNCSVDRFAEDVTPCRSNLENCEEMRCRWSFANAHSFVKLNQGRDTILKMLHFISANMITNTTIKRCVCWEKVSTILERCEFLGFVSSGILSTWLREG